MAHPKETRDAVRRAYVFQNLSLEMSALQNGVSFATASRWKKDAKDAQDDWDMLRSANMIASGAPEDLSRAILNGLMTQFQFTMEKLNNGDDIPPEKRVALLASLSDSYNKAIVASKKILPETSELAIAMKTVEDLAAFIQQHHPKHVAAFLDILPNFGELLEKRYG
jgi:hypothetical protein